MQLAFKCALISTALIAGMPATTIAEEAPKTVEIEIDRSLSPIRIYRRAERQAKRDRRRETRLKKLAERRAAEAAR